jgi:hypothetical protein
VRSSSVNVTTYRFVAIGLSSRLSSKPAERPSYHIHRGHLLVPYCIICVIE